MTSFVSIQNNIIANRIGNDSDGRKIFVRKTRNSAGRRINVQTKGWPGNGKQTANIDGDKTKLINLSSTLLNS